MNQKIKPSFLLVIALTLVLGLASLAAIAKNNDNKSSKSQGKSSTNSDLKNYEKSNSGKDNAAIHREKTGEISSDLNALAETEKNKGQEKKIENTNRNQIGNPDIGTQTQEGQEEVTQGLELVAEEVTENGTETAEAIEEVESQNKFKKMLVGTDYKNLGQLRSSLVHNRNQIRKLTGLSESAIDEETKTAIGEQLTFLMQERERIKAVITANESGFSLLGWVFRYMNGYPKDSIDEGEESTLEEEVSDVIEDEAEENDGEEEAGTTTE